MILTSASLICAVKKSFNFFSLIVLLLPIRSTCSLLHHCPSRILHGFSYTLDHVFKLLYVYPVHILHSTTRCILFLLLVEIVLVTFLSSTQCIVFEMYGCDYVWIIFQLEIDLGAKCVICLESFNADFFSIVCVIVVVVVQDFALFIGLPAKFVWDSWWVKWMKTNLIEASDVWLHTWWLRFSMHLV